jgi:hypothetical protein
MAEGNKREFVLTKFRYAWILDRSKGDTWLYCGPDKPPLEPHQVCVILAGNRFKEVSIEEEQTAIMDYVIANEDQYVILHNPQAQPREQEKGKNDTTPELHRGKIVVKRGPVSFALWPGQAAEVVNGHRMTEDQYLRIRITGDISPDDSIALCELVREEWQPSAAPGAKGSFPLTIGTEYIVRGQKTSFFIPPTGVTVLKATDPVTKDPRDEYVMNGVQLDADEYAALRNRVGRISYVRGSTTVIPCVDQVFQATSGRNSKFKAVSIDENSGVLLRTLAALTPSEIQDRMGDAKVVFTPVSGAVEPAPEPDEGSGPKHVSPIAVTAALPSTSAPSALPATQRLLPSEASEDEEPVEDSEASCEDAPGASLFAIKPEPPTASTEAVAPPPAPPVPPSEGEEDDQEVALPPGTELVVWRQKRLVFPVDGIEIVRKFDAVHILPGTARYVKNLLTGKTRVVEGEVLYLADPRCEEFVTRVIPEDTLLLWFPGSEVHEYDEQLVPCITIPQGTAALIQRNGSEGQRTTRRIIRGYATYFLEWDESLATMKISGSRPGQPKDYREGRTICYLWVEGNRINDAMTGRSREDCEVFVTYTLQVDFDPAHRNDWFNVDDYVYLVCEEVRSRLRGGLLTTPIDSLATDYVGVIRNIVLGTKPEEGHRPGIQFTRCGARLVDVYVNEFTIQDAQLREKLRQLQTQGVTESVDTRKAELSLEGQRRRAGLEKDKLDLELKLAEAKAEQGVAISRATEKQKQEQAAAAEATLLAKAKGEEKRVLEVLQAQGTTSEERRKQEDLLRKHEKVVAQLVADIAVLRQQAEECSVKIEERRLAIKRTDDSEREMTKAQAAATVNASIVPTVAAHLAEIRDSLVADKLVAAFATASSFRGSQIVDLAAQTFSALPGVGRVLEGFRRRSPGDPGRDSDFESDRRRGR